MVASSKSNDGQQPDSRTRLLEAAADLIAAAPGQDVPLRAICERAGVRLPTLYHFFGSKEGLLEAVVEHGFDLYLGVKEATEQSDPIRAIRQGWDAHVAFGLANPGFYALMYGQATPGRAPAAQARPTAMLFELTRAAAGQGRLTVTAEQAAEHVLSANIGVTLRQIVTGAPDPALSGAVREGVVSAITGLTPRAPSRAEDHMTSARHLLHHLPTTLDHLGNPEMALLRKWLIAIAES